MKQHFTKLDLSSLPSAYLDTAGHFYLLWREVGCHEEGAEEVVKEKMGWEDEQFWEWYDNWQKDRHRSYLYEYLEEQGMVRFCHWKGRFGKFVTSEARLTFPQKAAIRQFCKMNNLAWEDAVI